MIREARSELAMLDLFDPTRREPLVDDRFALALARAIQLVAGATGALRGPEGRRLEQTEIIAESQHFVRDGGDPVDSNLLPKEESTLDGALLAGATLADLTPVLFRPPSIRAPLTDAETRQIEAIIAVVLEPGFGRTCVLPGRAPLTIDAELVASELGEGVLAALLALREGIEDVMAGRAPGVAEHHDAILAVLASRLRLAIRTVGDGLLNDDRDTVGRPLLSTYRDGALRRRYEVEKPADLLERYLGPVERALRLSGIDPELARKVRGQLVLPATAVVEGRLAVSHLVGKEGTVSIYQNLLDLVRLGSDEAHPLATVLGSTFELARYAARSRRRDGEPLLCHSVRVAERLRDELGGVTETLWKAAIFHDYIEDNIWDTAFPMALVRRAGLAALVAFELSDPPARGVEDVAKANRFLDGSVAWAGQHFGRLRRELEPQEFVKAVIRPANPDYPYSVEAALIKLSDFIDTMTVGLHCSDRMAKDGWNQSGKRVATQLYKESILLDIVERLDREKERLCEESGLQIVGLLRSYVECSRAYFDANLAIVSAERDIDGMAFRRDLLDPAGDPGEIEGRWQAAFKGVTPRHDPAMAAPLDRLAGRYRASALRVIGLSRGS